MKPSTPYIQLHQRKRTWTPVQMSAGQLLPGGEEVVQRALALRILEIPVGDFITNAMKGDLPDAEGVKELLLSNINDEVNHDQALGYAAEAHPVPDSVQKEADLVAKTWIDFDIHPVLKAAVLERSVFFVLLPIFRFLGDTGLRTISADISRDEQTHVAAHTLVAKEVGASSNKALNALRRATVSWVVEPLNGEAEDRNLSANYWLAQSDSLYKSGKAPGLAATRASRQPAFFETSNVNLPQYA
tara:strand:+ start:157 stop:888 length:732 start_codon:yes stop_codon:yes gene_type:complete